MIFNNVRVLAPLSGAKTVESFCTETPELLPSFSDLSLEFVDNLSKSLLREPDFRAYPEMVALGYWLRRANISRLIKQASVLSDTSNKKLRLARGLVFHVAPSNVDTIFIYSLVISVLLGNKNIVRLSSKTSIQQQLILKVLNAVLTELPCSVVSQSLMVITYPHDEHVSRFLSQSCDARMLWGGDNTINYFSLLPIKPTSVDIKFANKYSLSLLDARSVIDADAESFDAMVKAFVSDSYLFGQQACSSPRAVCWVGETELSSRAATKFWSSVVQVANQFEHGLSGADFVEKLIFTASHAMTFNSKVSESNSMILTVIKSHISGIIESLNHCGRGVFIESNIIDLSELNAVLHRGVQTVTYFGVEKSWLEQWISSGVHGIDRIVPVGSALDFDYIWDGVDLFTSLSRVVTLR